MTLFERIKRLSKIRGMSLREVAVKAGFKSETAIYRYNQGVSPRKPTLEAIASALHTTTDYLEGKTDKYELPKKNNDNEHLVTMFREKTGDMTPDERKEFEESLGNMMDFTRKMIMERRKRHE
ncbi:helix-turn-helix domain-containing protein [uncultured Lactobacillus sp.]|uniref:helix-turn-helix domain-containing protein n=1 Tax=uncultured Lactobacillus sp. TaxID=153152 RepID=UPI002634AC64|nr:helix-turn-helix transcriptional regulator [uncultured Lactobacillus sp.]